MPETGGSGIDMPRYNGPLVGFLGAKPQVHMLLSALCMAGIFVVSVLPMGGGGGFLPPGSDKIIHAGAYGVLSVFLLLAMGFMSHGLGGRARLVSVSFLISSLYGVLLEYVQGFLGYRTFSAMDMAANAIGSAVALFAFVYIFGGSLRTEA